MTNLFSESNISSSWYMGCETNLMLYTVYTYLRFNVVTLWQS